MTVIILAAMASACAIETFSDKRPPASEMAKKYAAQHKEINAAIREKNIAAGIPNFSIGEYAIFVKNSRMAKYIKTKNPAIGVVKEVKCDGSCVYTIAFHEVVDGKQREAAYMQFHGISDNSIIDAPVE